MYLAVNSRIHDNWPAYLLTNKKCMLKKFRCYVTILMNGWGMFLEL
jgi:hypothetical protein